MIKFENLTKIYGKDATEVHALRSISFEIKKGEFVAIAGPSGCGKSTLLNILGCLDKPTSGSYFFEGIDVQSLSEDKLADIRAIKIGFVFQGFNLLPRMNVIKNVELPMIYFGVEVEKRIKCAYGMLKKVGLLDRIKHNCNELSGGQQQRVAIARALVNSPNLILADEPTGNLDTRTAQDILNIFKDLNDGGVTIILITHAVEIAKQAKRMITLKDGLKIADVSFDILKKP